MKILFKTAAIFILSLGISLTFIGGISYAHSDDSTLPDNIIINGLDCSGLTYSQAEKELTQYWNSKTLQITDNLDSVMASYTDLGCTYDIAGELSSVRKDHPIKSALSRLLKIKMSVNIAMRVNTLGSALSSAIESVSFIGNSDLTETTDAYVDMTDLTFPIVSEVYGTKPDVDKLLDDIAISIGSGDFFFKYDEDNYYSLPKVKSDDPQLLEYQQFCRENLTHSITYMFGNDTYVLEPSDIIGLLKTDCSGQAEESKVASFVAELAEEFDNVGIVRSFKSYSGKTINAEGGTYGWTIDQEKETSQLIEDINSHKDVSRNPIYSQEGYGEYAKVMGDTYIDVDVSLQKVVFYKGGKSVFTSDCVTGNKSSGTLTVTGTFFINQIMRSITLKGEDYESFVNYWLGFYAGSYGLHDASWRSSFGGDIWKTNGSHGCVNIPPSKMGDLYNLAEYGIPVIVHY